MSDDDYPATLSSGYPAPGGTLPKVDINSGADAILGGLSTNGLTGLAGQQDVPRVMRHRKADLPEWRDYQRGDSRETGMAREQSRMRAGQEQARRAALSRTATLDEFNAEFWDRWEDPAFQRWFGSRLIASGKFKAMPNPEQAYVSWVKLGEQAAGAQGWKGSPEQLLEFWASGVVKSAGDIDADIAAGSAMAGGEGEAAPNPITRHTSTSYASINPLAANAAVDQLSQALLGRMASKAEMARYRKAMNRILKSSPTVTTTTTDATDPDNVKTSSVTKDGASASDAQAVVEQKIQRSSEGQAFNIGKAFESIFGRLG